MKRSSTAPLCSAGFLSLCTAGLPVAQARAFPAKPMRRALPFPPGCPNDLLGRAIAARTDARAIRGMDEALRRAERHVRAGADGVSIESMLNGEEMARALRETDTVHVADMLEGGLSPIVKPSVLGEMAYGIALYGITLLLRISRTMQRALARLHSGDMKRVGSGAPFDEYLKVAGMDPWRAIEEQFGEAHPDSASTGH